MIRIHLAPLSLYHFLFIFSSLFYSLLVNRMIFAFFFFLPPIIPSLPPLWSEFWVSITPEYIRYTLTNKPKGLCINQILLSLIWHTETHTDWVTHNKSQFALKWIQQKAKIVSKSLSHEFTLFSLHHFHLYQVYTWSSQLQISIMLFSEHFIYSEF